MIGLGVVDEQTTNRKCAVQYQKVEGFEGSKITIDTNVGGSVL